MRLRLLEFSTGLLTQKSLQGRGTGEEREEDGRLPRRKPTGPSWKHKNCGPASELREIAGLTTGCSTTMESSRNRQLVVSMPRTAPNLHEALH